MSVLNLLITEQRIYIWQYSAYYVQVKNSYKSINTVCDEFKSTLLSLKYDHWVIVVAMGCAGRIFMKMMICDNEYNRHFYFDFGSMLYVFCGLNTRDWIEKTDILNKSRFIL